MTYERNKTKPERDKEKEDSRKRERERERERERITHRTVGVVYSAWVSSGSKRD